MEHFTDYATEENLDATRGAATLNLVELDTSEAAELDAHFEAICIGAQIDREQFGRYIGCASPNRADWEDNDEVMRVSMPVVAFIRARVDAALAHPEADDFAGRDALVIARDLLRSLRGDVSAASLVVQSLSPGRFDELVATGQLGIVSEAIRDRVAWVTSPNTYPVRELSPAEQAEVTRSYEEAERRFAERHFPTAG